MTELWQQLKQRKLVQWALAYAAAAFALLQGIDIVAQRFGWPDAIERIFIVAICVGFVITLLLAWYHGEQERQRVTGTELLIIALVLGLGAVLLWRVAGTPPATTSATSAKSDTTATTPSTLATGDPGSAIPAKSIAVLPFENLSSEKDNAYFAGGMQDMILTKLADIGDLKVISRTSTLKYGSKPENLKLIAQQLGVSSVLEGSVQKSGNEVLINVQLIDAQTDNHLWAESYQRTLDNIFGVEGEVAVKIADALQARLSPKEAAAVAKAPTTNPNAYALYLKANDEIEQFYQGDARPERAEQAIAYLQQAVADDPQFALAYATLARMQSALVTNQMRDTPELRTGALANVQRALALQPELAEAHKSFGLILRSLGENDQALQQFGIARQLAPNDADLAEKLAQNFAASGDWARATSEAARAIQLDPRNSHHYQWSASIDAANRRYTAAANTAQAGLSINPRDLVVRDVLSNILAAQGQLDASQRQLELMAAQDPIRGTELADFFLQSRRDPASALRVAQDTPADASYAVAGGRDMLIGTAQLKLGRTAEGKATLQQAQEQVNAALEDHPDTARLHMRLAWIKVSLGDQAAALQAADKSLALAESSSSLSDHYRLPVYIVNKAQVLAHFGHAAEATALLQKILQAPGTGLAISPAMLRLDSAWDPIRNDPHFQALLVAPADATSSALP
jgi:serine/threonine-protein kinase